MIKKSWTPPGHLTTQEVQQQRSLLRFSSTLSLASKEEEDGCVPHDSPSGNVALCSSTGTGVVLELCWGSPATQPPPFLQVSWSCSLKSNAGGVRAQWGGFMVP